MSAGHTPGPWVVDGADTIRPGVVRGYYVASASSGRIGQTFLNCLVTTDDECLANAELFAAAPNLLAERDRLKALNAELAAAVQAFLDYDEETTDLGLMVAYDDALTKSHAALTKHKETTC